jgi:hypothetical protein
MLAASHILIAVVALIECFLLITFTTYSWIESASSLVIENGVDNVVTHTTSSGVTYFDISTALKYGVDMENIAHGGEAHYADLKEYYSVVSKYQLSKATSPDGINFFFPLRNNTYQNASSYRKGDTTDYNTSYNYFDFVIYNRYGGRDFFFDNTGDYANVFTVNSPAEATVTLSGTTYSLKDNFTYNPDGIANNGDEVTMTYEEAIKSAMRMSIETDIESTSETHIYSVYGDSYRSIDVNAASYTDSALTVDVSQGSDNSGVLRRISDYQGFGQNPVFKAPKGGETESGTSQTFVSVRVWFEIMDPRFQQAFGFGVNSEIQNDIHRAIFGLVPSAEIGINFRFVNDSNEYNHITFNDFTFSNTANHVTEEQNATYLVYLKAKNPEYSTSISVEERPAEYLYFPLSKMQESPSGAVSWHSGTLTQNVVSNLKDLDDPADAAFQFIYGRWDNGAPASTDAELYTWNVTSAMTTSGWHYYNAYSVTAKDSASGLNSMGIWGNSSTPNVALVQFADHAAAVTSSAYNSGAGNYQILHNGTETMYIGKNADAYTNAASTATMHYDATNQLYQSYVPKAWFASDSTVYFNYASSGSYLTNACTSIRWSSVIDSTTAGLVTAGTTPVYQALGYGGNYQYDVYSSTANTSLTGVGTWGDSRRVYFSTELIDAQTASQSNYVYFVGVNGVVSGSVTYVVMRPGEDYQTFYADLPAELTGDAMCFASYTAAYSSGVVNGKWYATTPPGSGDATYYAVRMIGDDTSDTNDSASNYANLGAGDARGYWNVAALVDATYENLIYDTVLGTNKTAGATLQYAVSTDNGANYGSAVTIASYNGSSTTDINRLDQYRWYALLPDNATQVKWTWTPYDGTNSYLATSFEYIQDLSDGKYCYVTEAADATDSIVSTPAEPEPEP